MEWFRVSINEKKKPKTFDGILKHKKKIMQRNKTDEIAVFDMFFVYVLSTAL